MNKTLIAGLFFLLFSFIIALFQFTQVDEVWKGGVVGVTQLPIYIENFNDGVFNNTLFNWTKTSSIGPALTVSESGGQSTIGATAELTQDCNTNHTAETFKEPVVGVFYNQNTSNVTLNISYSSYTARSGVTNNYVVGFEVFLKQNSSLSTTLFSDTSITSGSYCGRSGQWLTNSGAWKNFILVFNRTHVNVTINSTSSSLIDTSSAVNMTLGWNLINSETTNPGETACCGGNVYFSNYSITSNDGDFTPPSFTYINCTSCVHNASASFPLDNSTDVTDSFNVTLDEPSFCAITTNCSNGGGNLAFSVMNLTLGRNCWNTATTSGICTVNETEAVNKRNGCARFIACVDDSNNEQSNVSGQTFKSSVFLDSGYYTLNLTIHNFSSVKKWELFTTPLINCSAVNNSNNVIDPEPVVCLNLSLHDISFISCVNDSLLYNFTIPYVEQTKFSNGNGSVNVTGTGVFGFFLNNYSTILNMTFDLFSFNSTLDASMQVPMNASKNTSDISLRGYLINNMLRENRFSDNSTSKEFNLLSTSTVSKMITLSSVGNAVNNATLTFNVSPANPEQLNYVENWSNTANFNVTGNFNNPIFPVFMFDSLNTEVSGRWSYTGTASYDNTNKYVQASASASSDCAGQPDGNPDSDSASFESIDLALQNNKAFNVTFSCTVSGTSGHHSGGGSCAIQATNGVSSTNLFYCYNQNGYTYIPCNSGTLGMQWVSGLNYNVFVNGVLSSTVSLPSGNVQVKASTSANSQCDPDYGGSAGGSGVGRVSRIFYGGLGGNYSTSTSSFQTGYYTAKSNVLLNTSSVITSVLPVFKEVQPSGCDARLYVSANNGTNWQEATSNNYLTFINTGTNLSYNMSVSITSTNNFSACGIYAVELYVLTSNPSNVTFYFGDNSNNVSVTIFNQSNSSNTPKNVTLPVIEINEYITANCASALTCDVPLVLTIASSTAGLVNVYNLEVNKSMNDLVVPAGRLQNYLSKCTAQNCLINSSINQSQTQQGWSGTWCYQETANTSTACGGLSSGVYGFGDNPWTTPNNLIDGDWSTNGYADSGWTSTLLINYSKPLNVMSDSVWQVKNNTGTFNYTIPVDCWSNNSGILQLKVESKTAVSNDAVFLYCNNGSWKPFETYGVKTGSNLVFEEGMFWAVGTTIQVSDLVVRQLDDGNMTVTCTDNTTTKSLQMLNHYSPFYLDFNPTTLDYLAFYPTDPSQKNVSPYGQEITNYFNRSIFTYEQHTVPHKVDLYVKNNESINTSQTLYTLTNVSRNDHLTSLNGSYQALLQNKSYGFNSSIYMFLDLYNATTINSLRWWNLFYGFCSDSGDGFGACQVID